MPAIFASAKPWKIAPSSACATRSAVVDHRIEIEIVRAARRVVELHDRQHDRRAQLDQRLHLANRVADVGDRALLDVLQAAGVDAAELPAVRTGEIDQLAARRGAA